MSLCGECGQRDKCSSLCPEAAAYVNQDYVSLKELLLPLESIEWLATKNIKDIELDTAVSKFSGLAREKQVVALMSLGLSRAEVAQVLGITRKNLREILRRISKKSTNAPHISHI